MTTSPAAHTSPLLCPEADKARLEAANGLVVLDYVREKSGEAAAGVRRILEADIRELHRLTVGGIYPCGGSYRRGEVEITGSSHRPPSYFQVPTLVQDALQTVNDWLETQPAHRCAAYMLWRLNWIHPFSGGNGRTSRAIANLVLSKAEGWMLPGPETFPGLIHRYRAQYIETLRACDARKARDWPDEEVVAPMARYLEEVMTVLLAATIQAMTTPAAARVVSLPERLSLEADTPTTEMPDVVVED